MTFSMWISQAPAANAHCDQLKPFVKAVSTTDGTDQVDPVPDSTRQTKHALDSMEELLWKLSEIPDKCPNIDNDLMNDFSTAAKVLWRDASRQSTPGKASTLMVKSATKIARSLGKSPKKSACNTGYSKYPDKRKTDADSGSNASTGIYAPTGSQLHTL